MLSPALRGLIPWSKDQVELDYCREILSSGFLDRARSGLGGSHTVVTYPPLDALDSIHEKDVLQDLTPIAALNFYVHIAFCEFLCPFCHYDTTYTKIGQEGGIVARYLDALSTEIRRWMSLLQGSALNSLYIGGGTPTAASEARLISLLELFSAMPRRDDLCISVETSPLTTASNNGKKKLMSLVGACVNRFSMGVQSFDSKLLRRSRGHERQVVLDALDSLMSLGVASNIDLIQDLPDQDDESILEDVVQISRFRPDQVTWYIMRLRPESAWYGRFRRSALNIAGSIESLRRRLLIREAMKRIGYTPQPGGRFVLDKSVRDRFKEVRSGVDSALLGTGVSAYSHAWGYFFRNVFSHTNFNGIKSYVALIEENRFAITHGCKLDSVELTASRFVKGIRSKLVLPQATPETAAYLAEASATLEALAEIRLVESNEQGDYSLTNLGSLFEEEVCSLFYSAKIRERLSEKQELWSAPKPIRLNDISSVVD